MNSSIFFGLILTAITHSAFASATLPAFDQHFKCTDPAVAQQLISDFRIDLASFGGKELCDSNVDTKKLLNDLTIVREGQFRLPQSQHPLIKEFVPADQYYTWAVRQTRGIDRGNDIPYATAYNSGGYFTMQDGWAILSTLGRVGTFIHEARHTAGYRHGLCQQGPYKETAVPGCDPNYNYGGSHAVEIEYYARVALYGTNFHPTYKQMARLMALARGNFVFNTPIIQPATGILVKSVHGEYHLYHHAQETVKALPVIQGVLKRTSAGASVFDGRNAFSLELYANAQTDVIEDDYTYYKFMQQDRGQGTVVDFEEFDIGDKRYVFYLKTNELAGYDFDQGRFRRSSPLAFQAKKFVTFIPQFGHGLYVIDSQNGIHRVNPENQQVQSMGMKWNPNVAAYAKSDDGEWILNSYGHLTNSSGITSDLLVEQIVSVPLYDSFVVKKE